MSMEGQADLLSPKEGMLETALKLLEHCDREKTTQYTRLTGTSMHACGYTAPGMAVAILFLEKYKIISLDNLSQITVTVNGQCQPLTTELLTIGLNGAIGYLWNLHLTFGVGLDQLIIYKSTALTDTLYSGVNIVSFTIPIEGTDRRQSVHHSCIYIVPDATEHCFVIDSWGEDRNGVHIGRTPSIRRHATQHILQLLQQIKASEGQPLNTLMQQYFGAPLGSTFTTLDVVSLNQAFLREVATHGFLEACSGTRRFGGRKRKTKKSKRKGRRTRVR